jgi:hypothetical protein
MLALISEHSLPKPKSTGERTLAQRIAEQRKIPDFLIPLNRVAQATRLCRSATRRTEPRAAINANKLCLLRGCTPQFRSAGRQPGGRVTRATLVYPRLGGRLAGCGVTREHGSLQGRLTTPPGAALADSFAPG